MNRYLREARHALRLSVTVPGELHALYLDPMMGNPARGERRQVIPPPPLPRLAGLDALRGIEEAAGLELWLSARHVHDWLDTPAANRAGLIPDAQKPSGRTRRAEALELAPELAGRAGRAAPRGR